MVTDRTVDIPALEISEDFTFQILNDDAFGPTIVYTLTIKSSDPPVVPGPIDVFTITIEEDEGRSNPCSSLGRYCKVMRGTCSGLGVYPIQGRIQESEEGGFSTPISLKLHH